MWHIKKSNELASHDLEQFLRLRQDIFIIEQESLFTDIDGKDPQAIHIFKKEEQTIISYCRVLVDKDAAISRVIVNPNHRGDGMGRELVKNAIDYIYENHPGMPIKIVAMTYLINFYKSLGFEEISDDYDIAGHLHTDMRLDS